MKNAVIHKYVWPTPSPIEYMECEPALNGGYKARMVVRDASAGTDLADLPKNLHKYGFSSAYADVWQGQNALVLPNIKEPQNLADTLATLHCVSGEPKHDILPIKQKKHLDTLKASGRVGLIGHASLMAGGALQGEWGRVIAGPMGASTAAILAKYGNGKSDIDFDDMLKHMHQYFASEGIQLPPMHEREHKQSILQSVNKALANHPIPIAYTIGSIGALGVIHSGFTRYMQTRGTKASSGLGLLAAGLSSLFGNMIVLFVPEKKREAGESDKAPKLENFGKWVTGLPKTWGHLITHPSEIPSATSDFIRTSPLRFNGALNFTDNIFYFIAALGERKTMHSWQQDHPTKINTLKSEMNHLLGQKTSSQAAKRLVEIEKEIPNLEKQLKLANSWQGQIVPYLTLVTAFSFGCATFLSAISSKNRDTSYTTGDAYERLYALVSKLVVEMPPEKRDDMITRMTTYLAAREEVKDGGLTAGKLSEEIKKRVTTLEKSPWIEHKSNHVAALQQQQATPLNQPSL